MSARRGSTLLLATALGGLLGGAQAASPESAGLAHCAAIDSASSRLACYDALAGRSAAAAQSPSGAPAAPTAPPAVSAAARPPAPAAAVAPASAPASSAAAGEDPRNFGLSNSQLHIAPSGPSEISAIVASISVDARGRSKVVLDNGQVWTLAEADQWLAAGGRVTIKRASLGSFLLITPQKHSYRATRTQ